MAEADELMHGGGDGATVLILFGLPMFALFVGIGAVVGAGIGLVAGLFVEAIASAVPDRRAAVRGVLASAVAVIGALSLAFPQTVDGLLDGDAASSAPPDLAPYEPEPEPPPEDAGPLVPSILAIARLDGGMLAIDRNGSRVVRVALSSDAGVGAVVGLWWSASRARAIALVTRDDGSGAVVLVGTDGSAETVVPDLGDSVAGASCGWVEARSELVCLAPEGESRPHAELVSVPLDGRPVRRSTWHRPTPTGLVAITADGAGVLSVDACDGGYCVYRTDEGGHRSPRAVATIERNPILLALAPNGGLVMATRSTDDAPEIGDVWYVEPPAAGATSSARRLVTMVRYDQQPYSVLSLAVTPDGASILATVVVGPPGCEHDCDPTLETIGPLDDPMYASWAMPQLEPSMLLVAVR
jgi:hypothetical protein